MFLDNSTIFSGYSKDFFGECGMGQRVGFGIVRSIFSNVVSHLETVWYETQRWVNCNSHTPPVVFGAEWCLRLKFPYTMCGVWTRVVFEIL